MTGFHAPANINTSADHTHPDKDRGPGVFATCSMHARYNLTHLSSGTLSARLVNKLDLRHGRSIGPQV
jgi:hypothetical protein